MKLNARRKIVFIFFLFRIYVSRLTPFNRHILGFASLPQSAKDDGRKVQKLPRYRNGNQGAGTQTIHPQNCFFFQLQHFKT